MTQASALRTIRIAGVSTLAIGTALLIAPGPVGARSDIDDPRLARAIGLADVTCAVGLLAGRPRWPWAISRTVLNVVQAALVVGRGPRGAITAAGLAGVTLVDGAAARELYRARV